MLEDEILKLGFVCGSSRALARIYSKYVDTLLTLAVALLNDTSLAEDVVHDVFLRFARSSRQFRMRGHLKSFLCTCVVNRARDVIRQRCRQSTESMKGVEPLHTSQDEPLTRVIGDGLDDRVGLGEVSSLIDLELRESLLLFHAYKTAQRVDLQQEFSNTGADQLLRLCAGPIDQLWRLQDGLEEDLGTETLDGIEIQGFRVQQDDEYFDNEINIWAEVKSGWPVKVEIHSQAKKPPRESITWTLSQFDKDSSIDPALFDMNVPML